MSRAKLLGENIRKYREQKGWSQQVFADFIVLSREYIIQIEKGRKNVSLKKLYEMADLFGVKVCDLMNFE